MSFDLLQMGCFVLTPLVMLALRLIALRWIPFRIVSTSTAATVGFLVYWVLPILTLGNEIDISLPAFSAHVCVAYAAFLAGCIVSQRPATRLSYRLRSGVIAVPGAYRLAVLLCVAVICFRLYLFLRLGGFRYLIYFWLYSNPIGDTLAMFEAQFGASDPSLLVSRSADVLFVMASSLVLVRRFRLGASLWLLGVLCGLTQYQGRSAIFESIMVPYIAYVLLRKPRPRAVLLHVSLFAVVGIMAFSWMGSVRQGEDWTFGLDRIVDDINMGFGGPTVNATQILANQRWRGDPEQYILKYVLFVVPRALWPNKPADEFNRVATTLLTGRGISAQNSALTSTILGEGWYYFGSLGSILLPFMLGGMSQMFEGLFLSRPYLLGAYANLVVGTLISMRSTLLNYFQGNLFVFALALPVGLFLDRRVRVRQTARRDCGASGASGVRGPIEIPAASAAGGPQVGRPISHHGPAGRSS